ncbi:MAG: RNA methyltransferase [Candidatus Bathyarchaeota archaeon]|nr:RNA methyltransferase [Candidatus Bathyarchaeota archaeon]
MSKKKISIAIPASIVSDTPHLREKTAKIGLIGRAAAIFRVGEIIIYPDEAEVNQKNEINLIATLLSYMETPQYLRKSLFKLKPELRYAGVLPPLRTPHHPLNRKIKNLRMGEYREGVTLSNTGEGTLIDIGVEQPALLANKQLPMQKRVTVKITRIERRVEVELANRNEISEYWGYTVTVEPESFGSLLKHGSFDLTIATSKYGISLADVAGKLFERWKKADKILLAFGAPAQGLYEIAKKEGLRLDEIVEFVVNTIPRQGTETVRTEEALVASLAVLNVQFDF